MIGVASSSLVLQNALVEYLDAFVSGPDKAEVSSSCFPYYVHFFPRGAICVYIANTFAQVIKKVRGSIEAIVDLDPYYRDQVVAAYSASLRATFIAAGGVGLITLLLVLPIRMPRLGKLN